MKPDSHIESAELRFKQILEEFFISVYNEKTSSAHGIDHHRRVWSYAKELITILSVQKSRLLPQLPSKLIIACYLHDIGMSVETGERHGKHSRELCLKFLSDNRLGEKNFRDVIEAVENHDRKDYPGNNAVNDLLSILSVADDLDAFGFTGIYRYLEIYLTRGIKQEVIGHRIKDNATVRFDHFIRNFGSVDALVQIHKLKFEILINFFNGYNKQVLVYKFNQKEPSGYCGVVEILLDLIKNKKTLTDLFHESEIYSDDPEIQCFFDGLKSELL